MLIFTHAHKHTHSYKRTLIQIYLQKNSNSWNKVRMCVREGQDFVGSLVCVSDIFMPRQKKK